MNALPIVKLAGDLWIIDERLGEVRMMDKPWERLSLDEYSLLKALEEGEF